jgi:hypothetical protein
MNRSAASYRGALSGRRRPPPEREACLKRFRRTRAGRRPPRWALAPVITAGDIRPPRHRPFRPASTRRFNREVLVPFGHSWPGADVELANHPRQWHAWEPMVTADCVPAELRSGSPAAARRIAPARPRCYYPARPGRWPAANQSGLVRRARTACDSVAGRRTQGWVEARANPVPG